MNRDDIIEFLSSFEGDEDYNNALKKLAQVPWFQFCNDLTVKFDKAIKDSLDNVVSFCYHTREVFESNFDLEQDKQKVYAKMLFQIEAGISFCKIIIDKDASKATIDELRTLLDSTSGKVDEAIKTIGKVRDELPEVVKDAVESTVSEAQAVIETAKEAVGKAKASTNEVTTTKEEAQTATKEAQVATEKANEATREATAAKDKLSNEVLTLMGVFATIITVILSLVSTSASWLNNSSGASAMLAFVVPNLVAVMAVVVLLGIVLKDNKIAKVGMIISVGLLVVGIVSLGIYTYRHKNPSCVRYVLSQDTYQIESEDTSKGTKDKIIKFKIEESEYAIPWEKDYFHNNGDLYFCIRHKELE